MPPTGEMSMSAARQRLEERCAPLRAQLDRLEALVSRAKVLEATPELELEPPVNLTSSVTSDEINAALSRFMPVRKRNERRLQQHQEECEAFFKKFHEAASSEPSSPHEPPAAAEGIENQGQQSNAAQRPGNPSSDITHPIQQRRNTSNSTRPLQSQGGSSRLARLSEISFNEVYSDGQANPKDYIVEYPRDRGEWYILRCDECELAPLSPKNPMRAAGRHLDTPRHGNETRDDANAIKMLGIRVLHCSKELAEKNNTAYVEWFAREDTQEARRSSLRMMSRGNKRKRNRQDKPGPSRGRVKQKRRKNNDDTWYTYNTPGGGSKKRSRDTHLGAEDIEAGEVYCFDNGKTNRRRPVVIAPLPFEVWSITKAAVLESSEALEFHHGPLARPHVDCFDVDPETNIPRRWAADFQLGGSQVCERQYPAVFIEGKKWQKNLTFLDWVSLSHLFKYEEHRLTKEEREGAGDYKRRIDIAEGRLSAGAREEPEAVVQPPDAGEGELSGASEDFHADDTESEDEEGSDAGDTESEEREREASVPPEAIVGSAQRDERATSLVCPAAQGRVSDANTLIQPPWSLAAAQQKSFLVAEQGSRNSNKADSRSATNEMGRAVNSPQHGSEASPKNSPHGARLKPRKSFPASSHPLPLVPRPLTRIPEQQTPVQTNTSATSPRIPGSAPRTTAPMHQAPAPSQRAPAIAQQKPAGRNSAPGNQTLEGSPDSDSDDDIPSNPVLTPRIKSDVEPARPMSSLPTISRYEL